MAARSAGSHGVGGTVSGERLPIGPGGEVVVSRHPPREGAGPLLQPGRDPDASGVEVGVLMEPGASGAELAEQSDHGDARPAGAAHERRAVPSDSGGVGEDRRVFDDDGGAGGRQRRHGPAPEVGQGEGHRLRCQVGRLQPGAKGAGVAGEPEHRDRRGQRVRKAAMIATCRPPSSVVANRNRSGSTERHGRGWATEGTLRGRCDALHGCNDARASSGGLPSKHAQTAAALLRNENLRRWGLSIFSSCDTLSV